MESAASQDVTTLLAGIREGDPVAWNRVLPLVYDDLRALAASILKSERRDHTLQPTALVHEAYLRLARQQRHNWECRAHFFAAVGSIIRRVLVDHARARGRIKRGRGNRGVSLDEAQVVGAAPDVDLIALDQAMTALAASDVRKARVVELRVFGRLTVAQTAQLLGVSPRTVHYDWRMATAWLSRYLDRERECGA